MKINRTNTIHFFAIIAVLLMPLMFTRPEEELTFTLYLFKSVTSVAMLLVFYVNFLWLVPKLIETDDKMKFVSINFFFIIIGAIIMMQMRGFEFRYIDMAKHFKPRHTMSLPLFYHVLIVLRDGLNLILSKVYNSSNMGVGVGETKFMTASQKAIEELAKVQEEIASQTAISGTKSQRIASEIIEKVANAKKKAMTKK